MDFFEMLSPFIGREVEVILLNDFVEGTLLELEDTLLVVRTTPTLYDPEGRLVSIPTLNIQFVRIL
jgi:hypothetical protein